jgi:dTDP-4-amino-4,6-dideoxygalactose transaminase
MRFSKLSDNARKELRETLEELAIFAGEPAFDEPLHVGRPNIGDRERLLQRIGDVVDRRWLTNDGPLVKEFERRVAEIAGAEHCVAVSSGTVGLQLAARALGFSGEVVMPSFTFGATAHALTWIGLTPAFCEIDRRTHTIDPVAVARAITPATGGILAVHLWGRPCDVEPLAELAQEWGLPLLFDAAHALGCSRHGRVVGSFGDAEVFSFHGTKIVSSGEGGAVTTNDGELASRLRLMRNFGFVEYDTVSDLGTNGKMSELAAAMGLTSLDSFEDFVAVNRRNYGCYESELAEVPGLALLRDDEGERRNYQYVVVEVSPGDSAERWRDELVAVLHAENVLARRYFHPGCHRMAPYADGAEPGAASLPVTEDIAARVLTLPTGTAIHESEIVTICSILRVAAENAAELRRRLAATEVRA